jgi:hypothetical protein
MSWFAGRENREPRAEGRKRKAESREEGFLSRCGVCIDETRAASGAAQDDER